MDVSCIVVHDARALHPIAAVSDAGFALPLPVDLMPTSLLCCDAFLRRLIRCTMGSVMMAKVIEMFAADRSSSALSLEVV